MNRNKFLGVAGGAVLVVAGGYYLQSDKSNFVRGDSKGNAPEKIPLTSDERNILFLASLAPSGHNTQPWFVQYLEPYHWIIGNDKNKWLPGVDPTQRETMLSIGAFTQNLEYAASNLGYQCALTILASNNQDEQVLSVKLTKASNAPKYNIEKIKQRRTLRSNYLNEVLKKTDIDALIAGEQDAFHWLPNTAKQCQYINEQTIEANRIQSYRDAAQKELANWIRFSSKDADKYSDGLTTASMEIEGVSAWVLRNFYGKSSVMKKNFREQNIDTVRKQVSQSAGWLLITSKDNAVATLLDTGRRLQKLWLNIREKGIAIHPMTQILEETATKDLFHSSIGIKDPVQFILRTGYVKTYPQPVSLRRSVDGFVRM
jgi:nitroreductase